MPRKSIKDFDKRWSTLKEDRSSYMELWYELSEYHLGHHGRFLSLDASTEQNRGYQRNTRQINNTSRLAARTLAAGMMAGITSPARPWFQLSSGDRQLNESTQVKQWLHDVQSLMYQVFSASNFYNVLHSLYAELGVFGTAAMGIFEDFDNVIWCKPYTVGSYLIGVDGQNKVDTFYREYQYSVGQTVKRFGIDNCSMAVQQQWERGNTEAPVTIMQVIEPNDDRNMISPMARDMQYRSVYYERGRPKGRNNVRNQNAPDRRDFLLETGFEDFPIMAPRWDVIGEDIYASDCPGMTTLGDTKTLQLGEKRMYQAVDKSVSPPLQGPVALKNKVNSHSLNPNEIVWADGDGLSSIYGNYRPDIATMIGVNDRAELRIKRGFYEDLFLTLINSDRRQITAREVAERHEEKLLMLGPVLERLHNELLDPVIDRTFNIMQRAGILPVPPESLQNRELEVEYISVLAQAQRMVTTGAVERVAGFTAQLAEVWPEARHKFDATQAVDDYSQAMGINPAIVRSDDDVIAITEAEAVQQQQAAAVTSAKEMADTVKTASDVDLDGDNPVAVAAKNAGLL